MARNYCLDCDGCKWQTHALREQRASLYCCTPDTGEVQRVVEPVVEETVLYRVCEQCGCVESRTYDTKWEQWGKEQTNGRD